MRKRSLSISYYHVLKVISQFVQKLNYFLGHIIWVIFFLLSEPFLKIRQGSTLSLLRYGTVRLSDSNQTSTIQIGDDIEVLQKDNPRTFQGSNYPQQLQKIFIWNLRPSLTRLSRHKEFRCVIYSHPSKVTLSLKKNLTCASHT